MATNYPSSIDSFSNPSDTTLQNQAGLEHHLQHSNANDAIEALETKVGADNSTDPTTHEYKINELRQGVVKGDLSVFDGTDYQRLPAGPDGYMLVADSAEALGVKYTTPTTGGTVTTMSVVSANGFAGTVANPTSTPAITLTTSITGVLKGNGTAISAASQGTDYYAPSGTDVSVADGGTGRSTATAYCLIAGGTTGTGAHQSVASTGSTGQVLTSNGSSALPSFQTFPGWTLLSTLTVSGGLASTLNSGTLTGYNRYRIIYSLNSSDSSTTIGMQCNSQTTGIYNTVSAYNTSIAVSGSSASSFQLCLPSNGWLAYGEVILQAVDAGTSNRVCFGSGTCFNGHSLHSGAMNYDTDITSFQFLRAFGSGTITGSFKIYGEN